MNTLAFQTKLESNVLQLFNIENLIDFCFALQKETIVVS